MKKTFITMLLSLSILCNTTLTTLAEPVDVNQDTSTKSPISSNYKEGFYKINDPKSYSVLIKQVTLDEPMSIIVLNSESIAQLYYKLDKVHQQVSLDYATEGYTIVVIGNGEVALIYH